MNKSTIIGIAFLLIATLLHFYYENDITDFLSGFFIGGGVVLLLSSIIKSKNKND
ncbi:hypothetical protein ACFSX9_15605 [Flavobacterium ardleyense]|uniref:Uncharacterized protein n=1 Tax=Flavobacterium ardleyense TaxID=2038737 RepID=A0ABW5ZCU7_9FLAO